MVDYLLSGSTWWISLLFIHIERTLWTVLSLVVHIKHIYKTISRFMWFWTHYFECEKKMEQDYLDGSVFAMVFLRAIYASAAVLNMIFLTADISLNIDIGLLIPGTEKYLYFSLELIFILEQLELYILSPPWPDFQKDSGEIRSIPPKLFILHIKKVIFELKPILILIDIVTFFHVKESAVRYIKWFMSCTKNCLKKARNYF